MSKITKIEDNRKISKKPFLKKTKPYLTEIAGLGYVTHVDIIFYAQNSHSEQGANIQI